MKVGEHHKINIYIMSTQSSIIFSPGVNQMPLRNSHSGVEGINLLPPCLLQATVAQRKTYSEHGGHLTGVLCSYIQLSFTLS